MKVQLYDAVGEVFGLRVFRENGLSKEFLIHNPLIGMNEKNELAGFVFIDKKIFTDAMRNECEKRFQTSRVNGLQFIKL